jgi:phage terminase large subunit-like protein
VLWLPEPPPGTKVCGGFDGSENDDHTAIKLETVDGLVFTPRYGPDGLPTIWQPAHWGGRIPRAQVRVAWSELVERFDFSGEARVYCDPGFHDESDWSTDIEMWSSDHPAVQYVQWPTNQVGRMYPALRRFEADLRGGLIKHEGCPVTVAHMRNARKVPKRGDTYTLGKSEQAAKIDAAVTSVLAHQAASDARASGWSSEPVDTRVFCF